MPILVHRGRALAALVLCLFLVQLDTMLLSVAAGVLFQPPPIGLGLTQGDFLWVTSAYTLALTGALLLAGWLGDRLGRRAVLVAGMVVFAVASAACACSTQAWQLVAGRAVLGLGAALVSPNTLATLVTLYPGREERARAVGLWSTAVGIALAVGPIVSGVLLAHYRWPVLFWINLPVSVVAVVALLLAVPETRGDRAPGVDLRGVLLSIGGLTLLVQGVIQGGDSGSWWDWRAAGCIGAGVVVLAVFVRCELAARQPMLDVRWFRVPAVGRSVALSALAFAAMSGVMFVLGLWMLVYRGYTPLRTGLLMLPLAAGQFVVAPLSARLVERLGARRTAAGGALLLAAALAGFLLVPDHGVLPLEGGMAGVGAALSLILPTATVEIQASIPAESAGAASGITNLFRQVGGTLGGAVLGSVLAGRYRQGVGGSVDGLPTQAADAARRSLQACYVVLQRFPATPKAQGLAAQLRRIAEEAFHSGYLLATLVGVGVALVAVVLAWGLPGRRAELP